MASPEPRPPVRVLVVDDHELFAAALRMYLSRDDRIRVVGVASSGQEAIDLALAEGAEVVLMDIFMRGMDGLEATKRLRSIRPETRVIVLTGLSGDEVGVEARAAGADGHLQKGSVHEELVDAVLRVAAGEALGPIQ
ncbi:MAG: response regulator transcription factor [Actinobacteria bacterium]|jgi:DNA-binding NarL/FixJ family response regulator|nr:MAG: response regulator transcription factor [Actinomycetota bacterium]